MPTSLETDTRRVITELVSRIGRGDPAEIAELYAPTVDWALDWPSHPISDRVAWVRHRPTRTAVRQHFDDLARMNRPAAEPTTIDRLLVDGADAVVLGVLRNVVVSTGRGYVARFALHLRVEDGLIVRHHVYEDSLAVALAAGAIREQPEPAISAAAWPVDRGR